MGSNSLVYNTQYYNKENKEEALYKLKVKIRLDDECNNGHQDFTITAYLYEDVRGTKWSAGGCLHDEILKHFPQFQCFVDLHLCDYLGRPMYATANGYYHLKNSSKKIAMDYLRITEYEYNLLVVTDEEDHFQYLLENMGIVDRWKREARLAIKELEKLTGKEFIIDSTKSNYTPLDKETNITINTRIGEGYYSKEKIAKRALARKEQIKEDLITTLKERAEKDINKIQVELSIKLYLLECDLDIGQIIYYNHSNELKFNWKDYGNKIAHSSFSNFIKNIDYSRLPKGIKIKFDKEIISEL